jgi:nucleotide-binding universal stress UspA family protein
MSAVAHILVPVDFSANSEIALDYAAILARSLGASVHVLHVLDDRDFTSSYPDGLCTAPMTVRSQLIEQAQVRLATMAAGCRRMNPRLTLQVTYGSAVGVIAAQAAQRGADMIVMGTHGRSDIVGVHVGSVAARVVRVAPCPVVTVRPTNRVIDLLQHPDRPTDAAPAALAS